MKTTTIRKIAESGNFDLNSPVLRALCWKYWKLGRYADEKSPENVKKRFIKDILRKRYDKEVVYKEYQRRDMRRLIFGLLLVKAYTGFYMWQGKGLVHPSFKHEIIKTRIRKRKAMGGMKQFASGAILIEEFMYDILKRLVNNEKYEVVFVDQTLTNIDFVLYHKRKNHWDAGFQVKSQIFCWRPTGKDWEKFHLHESLTANYLVGVGQKLKEKHPEKKFFFLTPELIVYGKWRPYLDKLKKTWDGIIYLWIHDWDTGRYKIPLGNLSLISQID